MIILNGVIFIENSIYKRFGIYGIMNKANGRVYIGKTGNSFGDRWDHHKALLRGGYHSNKEMQSDWNEFGEDQFEFFIVEEVDSIDVLDDLEKKCIAEHRESGSPYNIADGGTDGWSKGKHLSEETKRKIGEKNRVNMTGKKATEETKKKMSETHKKRMADMPDEQKAAAVAKAIETKSKMDLTWSDEQREKFSIMQRTRPNGSPFDIERIHLIRHMHENLGKSYREIAEELGMNRGTVYHIATYKRWAYV